MPTNEWYVKEVKGYVVGQDLDDARGRLDRVGPADSAKSAWDELGYWEREENGHLYDVYEIEQVEKVRKVT